MWRHGDIIIIKAETIPADATLRPSAILARGELTGHSHRIENPRDAEVYETAGGAFLRILSERARLIHDEHLPIELPQGVYRFWQQREYTPQAIRTIID